MGVATHFSDRSFSDGRPQPAPAPNDRRHDNPQSVDGDATILRERGLEVQRVSWVFELMRFHMWTPRIGNSFLFALDRLLSYVRPVLCSTYVCWP